MDLNSPVGYEKILFCLLFSPLAALATFLIIRQINVLSETKSIRHDYFLLSLGFLNGLFEVFMFSTSILIKIPSFIALWISVKAAVTWYAKPTNKKKRKKSTSATNSPENNFNKLAYLRFLIGTAVNIILSYIIASIVRGGVITFET